MLNAKDAATALSLQSFWHDLKSWLFMRLVCCY